MNEEEKNVEEVKEEVTATPVQEESKTEEVTPTPTGDDKKSGNKAVIIIMCIIIVALFAVILILLLSVNNNSSVNSEENLENTENTENNSISNEMDIEVKNINTNNNYKIKLVREYDENRKENEDMYIYNFYNKETNNKIGGIKLNTAESQKECSTDFKNPDCLFSKTKILSFNASGADYIYILLSKYYYIYDASTGTLMNYGYGATDEIESIGVEIVIKYSIPGDGCLDMGIKSLLCNGEHGYIFSKDASFELVKGKDAFKYNDKYAILDVANEIDPNNFKIYLYNEKGMVNGIIENGIAYNDNYVLTSNESRLSIFDYNYNKIGDVEFPEYDENKYGIYPKLVEENGKLEIRFYLKSSDEPTQSIYFDLN